MDKVRSCYCILEMLKQEEMFGLSFSSLNDNEKGTAKSFQL